MSKAGQLGSSCGTPKCRLLTQCIGARRRDVTPLEGPLSHTNPILALQVLENIVQRLPTRSKEAVTSAKSALVYFHHRQTHLVPPTSHHQGFVLPW